MNYHRWVPFDRVHDYLRLGWLALPTLEGTGHGLWSAHCVWLCKCQPVEPISAACRFPLAINCGISAADSSHPTT